MPEHFLQEFRLDIVCYSPACECVPCCVWCFLGDSEPLQKRVVVTLAKICNDFLPGIPRDQKFAFCTLFEFCEIFTPFGTNWDFGGGARQAQPEKGADKKVTLTVSFDEAFNGAEKKVRVVNPETQEKETLTIKVPAGAMEGGRVRMKGKGHPGANGGAAGDLLVTIKIAPDANFSRKGADVITKLPVSIDEAALGAQIVVPTPSGKKARVRVPAGTQDGAVLTLKGQGAPRLGKNASGTGDLKVEIEVKIPTTLNDEQKAALEAFKAATPESVRG